MQRRDFMLKTAMSLAGAGLVMTGCTTATPTVTGSEGASPDKRRRDINSGVDTTMDRLYATVPDARELVAKASGILVFPSVIAAGFGIGGQYGEGALRVRKATEGHYGLASVSIAIESNHLPVHDAGSARQIPQKRGLGDRRRCIGSRPESWGEWRDQYQLGNVAGFGVYIDQRRPDGKSDAGRHQDNAPQELTAACAGQPPQIDAGVTSASAPAIA